MPERAVTILVALLALAPGAMASWSMKGAFEPDTSYDVLGGWMTLEPNGGPARVLYFNGFGSAGGPAQSSLNPNSALAQSSVQTAPFRPVAMFGVWADCNGDGYVGAADHGLLEYPANVLLDDTRCPPTVAPPHAPWLAHNADGWVVEYMPVGYDDITSPENEDPLNLNDTTARVWADWGIPDAAPRLACVTTPTPYGTFRSSGGILRWIDCHSGHRGVDFASDAFESAGASQLSFHDAPADRPDRSVSPLNQRNPWGSESDPPAARVFDCRASTEHEVRDPTGGMLRHIAAVPVPDGPTIYVNGTDAEGRIVNVTVRSVEPSVSEGSPAGTVNETEAALTDCDRSNAGEVIDLDARQGGSDGDLPYALEGDVEPISGQAPRARTDHVLAFEEGRRGSPFHPRAREDAAFGLHSIAGLWVASGAAPAGPNPFFSREEAGPERVLHITYYAGLSGHLVRNHDLVTPAGGSAEYGAASCAPLGVFECDPERWWRNSIGADITPRDARLGEDPASPGQPASGEDTKIGIVVGHPYWMRDVDCIDTSADPARAAGLHWGALTGTACARPG